MISRIRIQNYRSLRDVTLEPGRINVLVGRNCAGKTNFLDALKFLTHVATVGLSRAFADRGGFGEVCWKVMGAAIVVSFEVHFAFQSLQGAGPSKGHYFLEVEGSPTGLLNVKRENLRIETIDVIDMVSGHGTVKNLYGSKPFDSPGNPSMSLLEFNLPGWVRTAVKQHMAGWRFYNLVPGLMKQLKSFARAQFLTELGDNVVEFLTTLKTAYSDAFRRIEQTVKDSFPDTLELIPQPTQYGQVSLTTRERFLGRPVTVWQMADGELAFIAFVALILSPAELGADLFCIEEPENHLHPRLLETLVQLLRQSQDSFLAQGGAAAQVFATTHSPYLVDHFSLDELAVLERVEGETKIIRPCDKTHLRELLSQKESGLGELWYSGALGGV
jgi:predicted ATPase